MDNNIVTILNEEFENDKSGEKVQGITIIIDGKLKEVVDLLMQNNPNYKNYTEIVRDAFFQGINSMPPRTAHFSCGLLSPNSPRLCSS